MAFFTAAMATSRVQIRQNSHVGHPCPTREDNIGNFQGKLAVLRNFDRFLYGHKMNITEKKEKVRGYGAQLNPVATSSSYHK
jgi:hypothetical protein